MAANLYEVLGLDAGAAPEDVRKAYRKKALSTHPDRLPPTASEEERQVANEQFRLVNNAYEVLNDAKKRKLYDQHRVWPPPTADASASRADPYFDAQYGEGLHGFDANYFHDFHFADPFDIFNSFFEDIHHMHGQMYDDGWFAEEPMFPSMLPRSMLFSPFATHHGSLFGPSMSPFGLSFGRNPVIDMMHNPVGGSNVRSYSSASQTIGSGGQWVSQSKMTRMVNGRTETIIKRRDAQGNEHITYSSPEGERHTINGIDQLHPNGHYLPTSSSSRPPVTAAPPHFTDYDPTHHSAFHDYAPRHHIPISSPHAPLPPTLQQRAVPIQKSHSTAEAYRNPPVEGSIRRSSSGRHHLHPERESSHRHHRDGEFRQSPTPRRSHESARGAAEGYFDIPEYAGTGTRHSPVGLTASPPPPSYHGASSTHDRDVPTRPSRHESRLGRDKHHDAKHQARRW